MTTESRARAWAQRGVTIAAVLACIATSRAGWTVSATLPAGSAHGSKGALVTIEASSEPNEITRRVPGSGWEIPMHREDRSTPWSGRGEYFLPPGFELARASISQPCSGGMCSKCEAPPGAFVRVANVEPVSPWSLEAKSEEQSVHAEASNAMPAFVVKVEGRRRVDLDVVITGPDAARFDRPFVNEAGTTPFEQTYHVIFYVKGGTAVPPADGRWVVRATMYGYCRGEGECRAPEGERLRIVSIAPR